MKCPECNQECIREEVDIGVGVHTSPWCCNNPECGWSQQDETNEIFKEKNKTKEYIITFEIIKNSCNNFSKIFNGCDYKDCIKKGTMYICCENQCPILKMCKGVE